MSEAIAGKLKDYAQFSEFRTIEAFNMHYRKLTYTRAEVLQDRPTYKRILSALFQLSAELKGVAFPKRETLATAAGCSMRSVDNFIKDAAELFNIKIKKAFGKKGRRRGGYAHLIYIFCPIEELEKMDDLPNKLDCEAVCEASNAKHEEVENAENSKDQGMDSATETSFSKQASPEEYYIANRKISLPLSREDLFENKKEEYALAYGVPQVIIDELHPFVSLDKMIELWKSIRGALRNVKASYNQYKKEVIRAIRRGIVKMKLGEVKKTLGAAIVGVLKGMISDKNEPAKEQPVVSEHDQFGGQQKSNGKPHGQLPQAIIEAQQSNNEESVAIDPEKQSKLNQKLAAWEKRKAAHKQNFHFWGNHGV